MWFIPLLQSTWTNVLKHMRAFSTRNARQLDKFPETQRKLQMESIAFRRCTLNALHCELLECRLGFSRRTRNPSHNSSRCALRLSRRTLRENTKLRKACLGGATMHPTEHVDALVKATCVSRPRLNKCCFDRMCTLSHDQDGAKRWTARTREIGLVYTNPKSSNTLSGGCSAASLLNAF